MGCDRHHLVHLLIDIHLHRSEKQLPPRLNTRPRVCPLPSLSWSVTDGSRYVVLMMGFYFAPPRSQGDPDTNHTEFFGESVQAMGLGWRAGVTKLFA